MIALALGIGADTAVFTIVNAALSYDVGVEQPERLVLVSATGRMRRDSFMQDYRDFLDLRDEVKAVEGLAAYRLLPVNVSDRDRLPERYSCVQMTANGFRVTAKRPLLGRAFALADELPGAARWR